MYFSNIMISYLLKYLKILNFFQNLIFNEFNIILSQFLEKKIYSFFYFEKSEDHDQYSNIGYEIMSKI